MFKKDTGIKKVISFNNLYTVKVDLNHRLK